MVGVVFVKHSQHNSKLMECWTFGLSDYRVVGLSGCKTIGLSEYLRNKNEKQCIIAE